MHKIPVHTGGLCAQRRAISKITSCGAVGNCVDVESRQGQAQLSPGLRQNPPSRNNVDEDSERSPSSVLGKWEYRKCLATMPLIIYTIGSPGEKRINQLSLSLLPLNSSTPLLHSTVRLFLLHFFVRSICCF